MIVAHPTLNITDRDLTERKSKERVPTVSKMSIKSANKVLINVTFPLTQLHGGS